jgi:N-carbamoylputrescine amidase
MSPVRVAACQLDCGPGTRPEDNCVRLIGKLEQAARAGARLALFPELSLSGYSVEPADILARARATTPGLIARLAQAVQALQVAAVVGVLEPAPIAGLAYNVSLALAPDGTPTRYRKLHVCPNEPFLPGETGPVVADLGFVRLALSVCYDNWYPETTRLAFLAGAQMLHVPFYWPAEWEMRDDLARKRVTGGDDAILAARRERMIKVFPGRALDNALYLVLVDHAGRHADLGRHMPGKSMVFDPYGELVAESRGWDEEMLLFDYDPARVVEWRENTFFPGQHLRPGVYADAYHRYQRALKDLDVAGDKAA